MNKLDIVDYIRTECEIRGITAYKIAQATGLSSVGIQKILNLKTKNPSTSTLNTIKEYIDNSNNPQNILTETSGEYTTSHPVTVNNQLRFWMYFQIYSIAGIGFGPFKNNSTFS